MKITAISAASVVALGLMAGATAQTPDGETPANEGVCDELIGLTPGLYGLCVAFCESQDFADESVVITLDELEMLIKSSPSGRILHNYNKKKKASDPDMPCILPDESCPCWSVSELVSIDGVTESGMGVATQCDERVDPISGLIDARLVQEASTNSELHHAIGWDETSPERLLQGCVYRNFQANPPIVRSGFVQEGTLTPEQATVCLEQVNMHCDALGH